MQAITRFEKTEEGHSTLVAVAHFGHPLELVLWQTAQVDCLFASSLQMLHTPPLLPESSQSLVSSIFPAHWTPAREYATQTETHGS
jgi:hypothetical protein